VCLSGNHKQEFVDKGCTVIKNILDVEILKNVIPFIYDEFVEDNPDNNWQTQWTLHPNLTELFQLTGIQNVLNQLLGSNCFYCQGAQVAIVYPQKHNEEISTKIPDGAYFFFFSLKAD
jgi:hypothetical protein